MHVDVVDIRDFYATRLGQVVRRHILKRVRQTWPDGRDYAIAGVGYAGPYLKPYMKDGAEVACFFPAGQGGLMWPKEGPRRAVLVDEGMFPLRDATYDQVLEIHGLEFFADVEAHLKEVWRVMRPEGRLLLIVPNRAGLWARVDTTPFGHGQPFSRGQLEDLLVKCWFRPLSTQALIHFAPFERLLRFTASPAFERVGGRVWPRFSGMLMVEAIKEVAQPIRPKGLKVRAARPVAVTVRPVPA